MSTTLKILAPYLPYAIEVEWKHGQARHYELTGLVAQTSTCYLEGKYSAFADDLLPVLRPFSQLTVPLPDGTVPAVEIGKQLHSGCNKAEIVDNHDFRSGRTCVITAPGYELSISEYGFNNGTLAAGLVDLLRQWHFAPLTAGKTLIEGVDYIPLVGGGGPSMEGGGAQ